MEMVFENMSKQELLQLVYSQQKAISKNEKTLSVQEKKEEKYLKEITHYQQENEYLRQQVAMLRRMQFGQKRERFEADSNQMALPFEAPAEEVEKHEKAVEQKIEYTRKTSTNKGRAKLPGHLPVEEIEIHPAGDLTDMVCIGKEVTEELECVAARFFIKRYIRFKYAPKNGEGVLIGTLPERVIDKGIPGAGLLATIITDKYVDHLPLYRQKQRFARENIQIAASTIDSWTKETLLKLEPLYDQLVFDTQSKGYLQVDETVCLEAAYG